MSSNIAGSAPPHANSTIDAILTNLNLKIFHLLGDEATKEYASKCVGTSTQYRHSRNYSIGDSYSDSRSWARSTGSSESYGSQSLMFSPSSSGYNRGTTDSANRGYSATENQSVGYQETIDSELRPDAFSRGLRTGGAEHKFVVDGIVYRPGAPWRYSGRNCMLVAFSQTCA